MLYKVTPMMVPQPTKPKREPGAPRKRRKTAIYDADGTEVLITLMCLKCKSMKPLAQFGLRRMPDGAIRNQPWCRTCRGAAGTPKAKKGAKVEAETSPVALVAEPAVAETAAAEAIARVEAGGQAATAELAEPAAVPVQAEADATAAELVTVEVVLEGGGTAEATAVMLDPEELPLAAEADEVTSDEVTAPDAEPTTEPASDGVSPTA
jgi:hypothetical protein